MDYRELGRTGLKVSRLCFGSLTMGPLQANLSVGEGAGLIEYAMDKGINFLDTAELYDNYRYIKEAIKGRPREDLIIVTKTYAFTAELADRSLRKALKEMSLDYVDVFMLHEQESELTLRGHYEAIEYFLKAKEKGDIRHFGISTHSIRGVSDSIKWNEIEIIHPIVNKSGLGIVDGGIQEMLDAVEKAYLAGKGIYAMKPLGGGNLIPQFRECIEYVLEIPFIQSVAIGMQCREEIDVNVAIAEGQSADPELERVLSERKRRLHIAKWCEGCGRCVEACGQGALFVDGGKVRVRHEKCTLCGYCASKCSNFCIKVV
ncbi:MAG: aldo/keto reductase [Bacillota bacterium]|nr:aldo/keto reductase [Bacillota bacterium]